MPRHITHPTRIAALGAIVALVVTWGAHAGNDGRVDRFKPVRVVVDGLRAPVHVVPAPLGRLDRVFVVEQGGRVLIADDGETQKRPFLDLRGEVGRGGLRGLLSLAFHPRYAENGRAYVQYVGRDAAVYVAEVRTVGGYASSRRILLRVPTSRDPYGHFGGHLAFGRDGLLYVGVGDGDDPESSGDPDTLLGKIVRFRPGPRKVQPEVVAWGLRNPWRFSFTLDGSALVIGDVGGDQREEIDVVPRRLFGRADLGWPAYEGTVLRARSKPRSAGVLLAPLVEYGHARNRCHAVVGGVVYRGSLFPRLRGRYVYGDLCGGMWSVRLFGRGKGSPRQEPFTAGGPLTSIAEGADRELLLVDRNGKVVSPVPR